MGLPPGLMLDHGEREDGELATHEFLIPGLRETLSTAHCGVNARTCCAAFPACGPPDCLGDVAQSAARSLGNSIVRPSPSSLAWRR